MYSSTVKMGVQTSMKPSDPEILHELLWDASDEVYKSDVFNAISEYGVKIQINGVHNLPQRDRTKVLDKIFKTVMEEMSENHEKYEGVSQVRMSLPPIRKARNSSVGLLLTRNNSKTHTAFRIYGWEHDQKSTKSHISESETHYSECQNV